MPIARYTTADNPAPQIGYVDGDFVFSLADVDGAATITALLQLSATELEGAANAAREMPGAAIPIDDITLLPLWMSRRCGHPA